MPEGHRVWGLERRTISSSRGSGKAKALDVSPDDPFNIGAEK